MLQPDAKIKFKKKLPHQYTVNKTKSDIFLYLVKYHNLI